MGKNIMELIIKARDEASKVIDGVGKKLGGLGNNIQSGFSKVGGFLNKSVLGPLDSLGGKINATLGKAFKVGFGAAAAAVGTVIALGVQRLAGIEDAQAKMKGLGYTGKEIDQIMDNALGAVRGTAFGIADAATVAAMALGSGVKPGQDLERMLGLVGDAATIGGASFDEMGAIFGKVAAKNKMSMQEANQMMQRGIPILQWLADEYGVTAEAASEMVSKGEVDFETFQKVVETNIGGAALASGDTTRGAFANMQAAAGRLGAALIGPIFGQVGGFFGGVTGWLDKLTDKAGPFAERFANGMGRAISFVGGHLKDFISGLTGASQAIDPITGQLISSGSAASRFGERVRDAFERVSGAIQRAISWYRNNEEQVRKIAAAAGPAVAGLMGLASAVNMVTKVLRILAIATPIGIILALATAFVYAYQNSERFREIVNGVFQSIKGVVGPIVEWITNLIGGFGDKNLEVSGKLAGIWDSVQQIFKQVFEILTLIIGAFVDKALAFWNRFGSTILSFLASTFENIQQLIQGALQIITGILDVVLGILTGDWKRAWEGIKSIFAGVWNAISAIVKQVWNVIRTIFKGALDAIRGLVNTGFNRMRDIITGVLNAIRSAITAVWNAIRTIITTVVNAIRSVITTAWNGISSATSMAANGWRTLLSGIWNAIQSIITGVVNAIRSVVTSVWNGISSALSGIMNGIRNTISSVWNSIKSTVSSAANNAKNMAVRAFNEMRSAVSNAINGLMNIVRGIPGKIRSGLGNLGNLLVGAGKAIIRGLVNGIKSMASAPVDAVKGIANRVKNFLPGSPVKEGPLRVLNRGYAGGQIVKMLASGILGNASQVVKAARKVAEDANPFLETSVGVGGSAAFAGGASGGSSKLLEALLEEIRQMRRDLRALELTMDGDKVGSVLVRKLRASGLRF